MLMKQTFPLYQEKHIKILLLDIETAPHTAHIWGLWNQNVGPSMLIESGYVMCWAAKWLGALTTEFASVRKVGKRRMLRKLYTLMEEADAIIHYNGDKFDIPIVNKEFLLQNWPPPAPAKQIDLLKTARRRFKFPSNKLDFIAKALGLEGKHKHAGYELWVKCLAGDPSAWAEMEVYNKKDVTILEEVYNRLLPWIKNHPNVALHDGTNMSCPHCASTAVIKRGFAYTQTMKYQRYKCKSCGSWSRLGTKETLTNVYV